MTGGDKEGVGTYRTDSHENVESPIHPLLPDGVIGLRQHCHSERDDGHDW